MAEATNGTPLESFRSGLDSARASIVRVTSTSVESAKASIKTANPKIGEKIEESEAFVKGVVTDFDQLGFWTNYTNFNVELLKPFKRADGEKSMLAEFKGTLTFRPENPQLAFVLWNVICFWLGILDMVLTFLFSETLVMSSLIVAGADAALGYIFAYYFYFVFVCSGKKMWMLTGFIALAVYVCIVIVLCYQAVMAVHVLDLVLNLLKILANSLIAYHAYQCYQGASDGKPVEML